MNEATIKRIRRLIQEINAKSCLIDHLMTLESNELNKRNIDCKRCDTTLDINGYCRDETCPYSNWGQEVPNETFDIDVTMYDIYDACLDLGIRIKNNQPDRQKDNKIFTCIHCGYLFADKEYPQCPKLTDGWYCQNTNDFFNKIP